MIRQADDRQLRRLPVFTGARAVLTHHGERRFGHAGLLDSVAKTGQQIGQEGRIAQFAGNKIVASAGLTTRKHASRGNWLTIFVHPDKRSGTTEGRDEAPGTTQQADNADCAVHWLESQLMEDWLVWRL
jgi:hypothetical protein